jgi:hypothetical protein
MFGHAVTVPEIKFIAKKLYCGVVPTIARRSLPQIVGVPHQPRQYDKTLQLNYVGISIYWPRLAATSGLTCVPCKFVLPTIHAALREQEVYLVGPPVRCYDGR